MADRFASVLEIEAAIRRGKRGRLRVSPNLYLQTARTGTSTWVVMYRLDGRNRAMGLGNARLITLARAREKALEARRLLAEGIDPITARDGERTQARLDAAKSVTFADCATRYIEAHRAGWRNPKHAAQWQATVATYAFPVFGSLPVQQIDVALIMQALEPIWSTLPATAARVRGRVEAILDWATARGYRTGDNPARWKGHLDKLLPKSTKVRRVKHHTALPYRDLPAFLATLRQRVGITPRALEFVILTAARTSEAIGAKWDEIDLAERIWIIPGTRMKSGREHRVPLSDRVVELLRALPRIDGNDFVFPGNKPKHGLNDASLLKLLRDAGASFVPHGFRSSFRDWAAEVTNFPREVAELALAHTVGNAVEQAYRRSDLFDKRRRLMDAWAAYCTSPPREPGEVVPLHRSSEAL